MEKGETAKRALSNELLQETGLKIVGTPVLHGVFHNRDVSQRDHVLAYLCDVDGRVSDKPASMEISSIGYFDPDDLPVGTDPGTVRRIKEIVEGTEKGDAW